LKHSIQPFLTGIIDYAGLYPPASLSLEDAFSKYIDHTSSRNSWMLSRFVAGTKYLSELSELVQKHPDAPIPFPVAVAAAPSDSLDAFKDVVRDTKRSILEVVEGSDKQVVVPSLEIKLPTALFEHSNTSLLEEAIGFISDEFASSPDLPKEVFFEISGFSFNKEYADMITKALSDQTAGNPLSVIGFKIRCGGVEAFHFPPTGYLAHAISVSFQKEIPLKFTAGLHHPVRHYNDSVSTKMHGFLNVFGSAMLCYNSSLSKSEIQNMLEDEDPNNFVFSESGFSWKSHSITVDEVQNLRSLYVTSFGSCSFEEPIEDLQELALLT
jgi:hypothetical protein